MAIDMQYDKQCANKMAERSKREHGRILPCSKHVHERLAHEKTNGDADGDLYHDTPGVNAVARCRDRPSASL